MLTIARIRNDFQSKFGVPRQSGIAESLESTIVFEPPFRQAEALRGLEGFSHVWLLWEFSELKGEEEWRPTVRPPRLGGNQRMGVFATRSPFRPNRIGLSSVRLLKVELSSPDGPLLRVAGADLMDGTPIIDIKPYLPYTDCHEDATGGFTDAETREKPLEVILPDALRQQLSPVQFTALREALAADPRPRYHRDPSRVYTMLYAGRELRFRVDGTVATVLP
ncbi:MAG: tRNA (N6-threonylcarbamoyladenosine(37)-N6)-methyltransferase TrmO [Prevotellaceae bacterium]|nr:tRNA (N6-threonylcarbamoyladenosine(37)-N6)-methyltransferase TrmO [Prevotellaceae bacterium]